MSASDRNRRHHTPREAAELVIYREFAEAAAVVLDDSHIDRIPDVEQRIEQRESVLRGVSAVWDAKESALAALDEFTE